MKPWLLALLKQQDFVCILVKRVVTLVYPRVQVVCTCTSCVYEPYVSFSNCPAGIQCQASQCNLDCTRYLSCLPFHNPQLSSKILCNISFPRCVHIVFLVAVFSHCTRLWSAFWNTYLIKHCFQPEQCGCIGKFMIIIISWAGKLPATYTVSKRFCNVWKCPM